MFLQRLRLTAVCLVTLTLLGIQCTGKASKTRKKYTPKSSVCALHQASSQKSQASAAQSTEPTLAPDESSLVPDATTRIKKAYKDGDDSVCRVVCTYNFSGEKVEVSTKSYSLNYHEKPSLKIESFKTNPRKVCKKRFEVIHKSCNPTLVFLEKDYKFHNQRLQSKNINLPQSFFA